WYVRQRPTLDSVVHRYLLVERADSVTPVCSLWAYLAVMEKGDYPKTMAAIEAYHRLQRGAITVLGDEWRNGPTLHEWAAAQQAVRDAFISEGGTLPDGHDTSPSYIEWLITGRSSIP